MGRVVHSKKTLKWWLQREKSSSPKADASSSKNSFGSEGFSLPSTRFSRLARRHGFIACAILDIRERRNGSVFPKLLYHDLDTNFDDAINGIGDISNCSAFLILNDKSGPFPFTTGFDCRDDLPPSSDLLDNELDLLLNSYGVKGGYCVPVGVDGRDVLIMYFSPRQEFGSRYPGLVIETFEIFDEVSSVRSEKEVEFVSALSETEKKILHLLYQDNSLIEIAENIGLSEHTVSIYIESITNKMDRKSIFSALMVAARRQLF